MQNKAVVAVLGWVMVSILLIIAFFIACNFVLVIASFLVWDSVFTYEATWGALRLSALIGTFLAAFMIWYDFDGFYEAWSDFGDDD